MKKKILLVVLLLIALPVGGNAYWQWQTFHQAEEHYRKGDDLLVAGDPTRALGEFEQALKLWPDYQGAWIGAVEAQAELKDADQVISRCDQALTHFPQTLDFYRYKAAAYRSKGDAAQEVATLEAAVKADTSGDPLTAKLLEHARKTPAALATPAATP